MQDGEIEIQRRMDEKGRPRKEGFSGNRAKINVGEENLIRASSLVDSFSLPPPSLFVLPLLCSVDDLDGSADVSFHNLIVLIKFRRGIALRWAYRPGGHNANRDVYRMNRRNGTTKMGPVPATFSVSPRRIRRPLSADCCGGRAEEQIEKLTD